MITLLHDVTKQPITIARLRRDELLVKRYTMPEKVGSLFTPAADNKTAVYGADRTQTLWEVVCSNPKAEDAIGMHIPEGAIVQTLRRFPRDTNLVNEKGEPHFLLSVEVCGVRGVITYTIDEDDD